MKVIKTFNGGSWIYNSKSSSFEEADVVVMPGGGDWNPALYGHTPHGTRYWNEQTDKSQMDLINKSIKAGKLLFGICRGLQALTIRAGGWLIQDVQHPSSHLVTTLEGTKYNMNSCHHQMCYPYSLDKDKYTVYSWTEEISPYYKIAKEASLTEFPVETKDDNGLFKEPEIIWYPEIRALGCQGHPKRFGVDK